MLRVLVVDDSPVMRSFIRRVVKLSGLPVETILEAANGLDALQVLDRENVQLLLTDINMPEMNGEQLIRTLSESGQIKTLPVIVVSTDGTAPRRELLTSLGARGYLEKPFQPEQLREQMERILEEAQIAN